MVVVSVCLVTHNAIKMTEACLFSLIERTHGQGTEIFLVDNNSIDGTAGVIKQHYPQIIFIQNSRNLGFGAANNLALKRASGKYVLLLNNDTILKNDIVSALINFAQNHPRAGIITGRIYEADGKTIQRNCRSFPLTPFDTLFGRTSLLSQLFPNNPVTRRNTLSDWDYNSPRQVAWVSGACMLIRREVLDQIGLLDENFFMYWEDTDLCKRAHDAGWEVWYTPEGEIVHYSGEGGGKRSLRLKLFTIYQMHRSAYYYFRKHYYKNPFHPLAVLAFVGMIALVSVKSVAEISKSLSRMILPS